MLMRHLFVTAIVLAVAGPAVAADVQGPISQRFQSGTTQEVPQFRKHMVPLMGKLGCNGRACHGSFQGRGGFRLSLFGYDFKADHEAMTKGDDPRANPKKPLESLVLRKPTNAEIHEGGQRFKVGSWEYHVFKRWLEGGAAAVPADHAKFLGLDITPNELPFRSAGIKTKLKVVAKWSDGSREDVTALCRFQSNDTQVCQVTSDGLVTSGEPGDTHVIVFYDTGVVPVPVLRPVSGRVGSSYPAVATPTKVDEHVVAKLRKLGLVPSELSTDAEFLRRVSLDLTGTLPSPKEVQAFLADRSPNKRQQKIDELLKSPAYAAWWTTKICDFTGNNDQALVNVSPVRTAPSQEWYDWIHKRVAGNVPYDKLVEGIVVANSRNKGESFEEYCKSMSDMYRPGSKTSFADRDSMPHYWARRTFRRPEERVIGFAYTFLGIRIQCAQCHKHPFDRWTKDDFAQFQGFFASTQAGIRDRNAYNEMTKKLGVEGRGNQVRREFAKFLEQGKVVPFQEVYATRGRAARNQGGNNNTALRNARRQITTLQTRLAALKKANKTEEAKKVEQQLTKQRQTLARLQRGNNRGNAGVATAKLLGGESIDLSKHEDPRVPLMNWLRDSKHGMLSRAFVNRVWASYFSAGIINPADDLSLGNPPSNKPLLDYLTKGFIDSGYDMKWLHREILNSRTYQLSWKPNDTNKNDTRNFSRAIPRRLPAEVVYDALQQATGSDELHALMRTKLTGRAIAMPGTGGRNNNRGSSYALTIFGRSVRESNCDCDRSEEASLLQTVYLQNDQDVYSMLTRSRDGWLRELATELKVRPPAVVANPNTGNNNRNSARQVTRQKQAIAKLQTQLKAARKQDNKKQIASLTKQLTSQQKQLARLTGRSANSGQPGNAKSSSGEKVANLKADEIVNEAYLRTLSRLPTSAERNRAAEYIRSANTTIDGVRDVLWALINTKEFIVNH